MERGWSDERGGGGQTGRSARPALRPGRTVSVLPYAVIIGSSTYCYKLYSFSLLSWTAEVRSLVLMFVDIYLQTPGALRTNFGHTHLTRSLTREACEVSTTYTIIYIQDSNLAT